MYVKTYDQGYTKAFCPPNATKQKRLNYFNIQNYDILFQMFWKKTIKRLMLHYNCTLVDIRHLINLRWLALV
jgi:hypothetical protein